MKRWLIVLAACGGAPPPKPSPVQNRAPAPAADPTPAGSIDVVDRDREGGIIELHGDKGTAFEDANREMTAHCGKENYTITQEGEEAVGGKTAWRVHYACNGIE